MSALSGSIREAVVTYRRTGQPKRAIASSCDVKTFVRDLIGNRVCEAFLVIAVDAAGRPVAWSEISRGTISSCQVATSDVLRFALLAAAPAFIIAHNHPSGVTTPSAEDIALTERIVAAAQVVGLRCVDHVIVSDVDAWSFIDNGVMPFARVA